MQAAYADHLHKPINCSDDLPQTCRPEYAKQREYFYDAEGMRRNLRDVIENGEQEFDALKVDLYDGICDTCASDYADGLLRMRATLSQAAGFPLSGSVIAQFPSMIKAAEKKGLCHMLVNDHMLSGYTKMNNSLFNTTRETATRLTLCLPLLSRPSTIDEIAAIDLIATYMKTFGFRQRNLHGDGPHA